jgi:hypothetical protein
VRHATAEQLEQAFAAAARARRGAQAPGSELERSARRVLDLRSEVLAAEPCPAPVLRRIQGWYAARPRSVARGLLALIFDSASSPVPAMRGGAAAPRTLRYAADGATVDVQVRDARPNGRTLHVAVSPAPPQLEVHVRAGRSGPGKRLKLDAAGTGELKLPAKTASVDASFRVAGVESFRIAGLKLR